MTYDLRIFLLGTISTKISKNIKKNQNVIHVVMCHPFKKKLHGTVLNYMYDSMNLIGNN
jgi:hypothetical protein